MSPPAVVPSYKSYAVTVRPRDGVTPEQITKFMKWVRKMCVYYYVVTEGEGATRHIHAGLFMYKAQKRSNLCTALVRQFPELDNEESRILKAGVRVQYDINFIESYLTKDEEVIEIASTLPEVGKLEGFWPPAAEQAKAKAAKAVDKYFAKLEMLWNEHRGPSVEVTQKNVGDFLFDMMYDTRAIRCIVDPKRGKQTVTVLLNYLSRKTVCDYDWAPWEK